MGKERVEGEGAREGERERKRDGGGGDGVGTLECISALLISFFVDNIDL
jgi:hypothetical protein